jgi:hypothetical protein
MMLIQTKNSLMYFSNHVLCPFKKGGSKRKHDQGLDICKPLNLPVSSFYAINFILGRRLNVLLIVVLTHIGNKFTYRLGLHFCEEVYIL